MKRALTAVLLVACSDVRSEPMAGKGGAPSLPVGGAPSFGGAPMGGAQSGGNGGGEPGPVPGCESLVWAGEPFLIPGYAIREVVLARLANGAVGIVYVEGTQGLPDDRLTSRVIEGAFDSWPPTVIGEAVVHKENDLVFGSASITARDEGTFALVDSEPGIYRFGVPGMLLDSYPPYTYPFVEPDGDGAFFIERPQEGPLRFYKRASVEPIAPVEELGEMPQPDFCSTAYAELSGTPTFLFASRDYCYEDDAPFAQFYQPGPTQIQIATVLLLPFFPQSQVLAARPGGFWYAISRQGATQVFRLTPTTMPLGEPIVFETDSVDAPELALWRDGFAFTARTIEGLRVEVSNGEQITHGVVQGPGTFASLDGPKRLLPGGKDDRSILVSVPQLDGLALLRADCVSP